jgi:hypothetical protein
MHAGFLRERALPSRLFAWKNSLFVASRARIRAHPRHVYESALRYVERHGGRGSGKSSATNKNWWDVGGSFERMWQDIFGRCGYEWTGCDKCEADCGQCTSAGQFVSC